MPPLPVPTGAREFHKNGELIGYAKLSHAAKASQGAYDRRYFWFKTDRGDPFPGEDSPWEAVKVSSIKPGAYAIPGRDAPAGLEDEMTK